MDWVESLSMFVSLYLLLLYFLPFPFLWLGTFEADVEAEDEDDDELPHDNVDEASALDISCVFVGLSRMPIPTGNPWLAIDMEPTSVPLICPVCDIIVPIGIGLELPKWLPTELPKCPMCAMASRLASLVRSEYIMQRKQIWLKDLGVWLAQLSGRVFCVL